MLQGHLYQLNHVRVLKPGKADSITTVDNKRLCAFLETWNYSKKLTLAFRSKAMLQLGQCADKAEPEKEYREQHANGELRHPLLVSLRVRIEKKNDTAQAEGAGAHDSHLQHNSALEALVAEVEPCSLTAVPSDAVDAIHGLLAAGPALTSERFMASSLKNLAPSPFVNILVDGQPSEKAIVLLPSAPTVSRSPMDTASWQTTCLTLSRHRLLRTMVLSRVAP